MLHFLHASRAQNGNSEVQVYFINVKNGYTVRKIENDKWI
jgi:hypothetical protein